MYITPHTYTQKNTEKHASNMLTLGPPVQVLEGLFWGNLRSMISLIEELLCFTKSSFFFNHGVSKMALEVLETLLPVRTSSFPILIFFSS